MPRRALLLAPILALLLVAAGCEYDYFFVAFEIECPLDEDGEPTRCYPRGTWVPVRCTQFLSSPFEILAGEYSVEVDIDVPEQPGIRRARFPRRLGIELVGLDAQMEEVFQLRPKKWRVKRRTGRVEETLEVEEELVVPPGGKLCLNIFTRGPELQHGWLAGLLFEPVPQETASP